MTTKQKIIAGFIAMMVLLSIGSGIGYFSLSGATESFMDYRRLARLNVLSSDLVTHQLGATSDMRQFRITADPKMMDAARRQIKDNQALLVQAETYASLPQTKDILDDIEKHFEDQGPAVDAMQQAVLTVIGRYEAEMLPALRNMSKEVMSVGQVFYDVQNKEALQETFQLMDHVAAARAAFDRLAYSRNPMNAEQAASLLGAVGKDRETLGNLLHSAAGRGAFAELRRSYDEVAAISAAMQAAVAENMRALDVIAKLNADIRATSTKLSENINELTVARGTRAIESNATAQTLMMGGAVAGLLIGACLAGLIVFSLVRTLRGMSNFASAVASGDFAAQMNSREKGEIGATLAAMRQIPTVLQSILGDYRKLETQIENGELRAKGDPTAYKGGFSALVEGTNAVLDRFLTVLENIPSPVVVLNQDMKITYMNAVGRAIGGSDYQNKTCSMVMAREDDGTPADALRKAVDTLKPASGETVAHPQGKRMDISYTAIPMMNQTGKPAAVLQLITDLTAIKDTQRTIQRVAEQAATISSRVAAASEQLSAQVEQVSRGAEMQRDRVESTASAMTEMNATVLEVAKSAGQASDQSEMTRDKAKDGANLVDQVVRSINLVDKVAANLQTNMQELGTQAESIGGVMNVISDIADQTNLLALNAAIEAARAGEAGRGFAVVADEVRKLAEKTMTATQEVGANITAIQNSTRVNINEVNEAAKAINEATGLANTSGQALSEIVNLAATNSAVVASIATAAEEQSATSEEISHAIEEINKIVGETAEGMVQSSSAVQELASMAQELNTVMAELQQ